MSKQLCSSFEHIFIFLQHQVLILILSIRKATLQVMNHHLIHQAVTTAVLLAISIATTHYDQLKVRSVYSNNAMGMDNNANIKAPIFEATEKWDILHRYIRCTMANASTDKNAASILNTPQNETIGKCWLEPKISRPVWSVKF